MTIPPGHFSFSGNKPTVGQLRVPYPRRGGFARSHFDGAVGANLGIGRIDISKFVPGYAQAVAQAAARQAAAAPAVQAPAAAIAPQAVTAQDAASTLAMLKAPFPQMFPNITLWTDLRGDKLGGKGGEWRVSPGVYPVLAPPEKPQWIDEWSFLNVYGGTKVLAWRRTNFDGANWQHDMKVFTPGDYNLHGVSSLGAYWKDKDGPHSAIIMPNVDYDRILTAGLQGILQAARPENGCVVNSMDSPLVEALRDFYRRLLPYFRGTPLQGAYEERLNTQMQQIQSAIQRSAKQCRTQQAPAPPPLMQFYIVQAGAAVGPLPLERVGSMITARQVTRQTLAWKSGLAAWTPAGQIRELQRYFGAVPPQLPVGPPPVQAPKPQRPACSVINDPGLIAAYRASSSYQQTPPGSRCFRPSQAVWRAKMG